MVEKRDGTIYGWLEEFETYLNHGTVGFFQNFQIRWLSFISLVWLGAKLVADYLGKIIPTL